MDIKKKILLFIEYENDKSLNKYSKSSFCKVIEQSPSFLNTEGSVQSKVLNIIHEKFPDLNMNWLLFNEGEMILNVKKYKPNNDIVLKVNEKSALYKTNMSIDLLKDQIRELKEDKLYLQQQLSSCMDNLGSKSKEVAV